MPAFLNMAEFLNMGGYATYVWPAYIVTLIVLVGLGWAAHKFLKTQERTLQQMDSDMEAGEADSDAKT